MFEEESVFDRSTDYTVGTATLAALGAAALIALNLGVMLALAPTLLADALLWTYEAAPGSPLTGVVITSVILSVGRVVMYPALGYDPETPEDTIIPSSFRPRLAAIGLAVTMLAFGVFGAAALSLVPASQRLTVVGISVAITGGITAVCGGLELLTERDLAGPGKAIHGLGMVGGVALLLIGYVVGFLGGPGNLLFLLAFAAILLGWIGDLIHEISVLTDDSRPVIVNMFGLYAAVMGVLVHIIWLVARAMAEDN